MTGPVAVHARGLTFTVTTGGPPDGPAVLLLHGFPQDAREWEPVAGRLHAAGLWTVALDQRGYADGARPSTVDAYRTAECVADVTAVLDALGLHRVHVVGHDWGAIVGWHLAAGHPDRVASLTAVSVPHPAAVRQALLRRPDQALRLAYIALFRCPGLAERVLLARDGAALRRMMAPIGRDRAGAYADAMVRRPDRLTAALRWYRAMPALSRDGGLRLSPVRVPTTYVWSDRDGVVTAYAARRCREHVEADYRFVALTGVSHWVPEQAPDRLAAAVVERVTG